MVAALTNLFAHENAREKKSSSMQGFCFTLFVAMGVVAGLYIAPIIIAACLGGPVVGLVFSILCALPLALLVAEACAHNWYSRLQVGIGEMLLSTLGFGFGVALVVLFLASSPMLPNFFAGAVASLTFLVSLPLITFLWFAFRLKVWKVR